MTHYAGPYWLLGLPFDAIDMDESVERIHAAARTRSRLLFVTPNVNFVAMASRDAAFRETVLHSQLSLVDGMPLVWLGRSMGIPFRGRVAGSSLLDRLARDQRPLRVYFFGGPPGAARLASERLPALGRGLVPVGRHTPGFGSIESMSSPALIDSINESNADFLVVALGAKKGHEWIARNLGQLRTPVVSHLGASINFLAGTIARSPAWMQAMGLEWVWRILQEPALVRRYWEDGWHYLPAALALARQHRRALDPAEKLHLSTAVSGNGVVVTLEGSLTQSTAGGLQASLESTSTEGQRHILLDVSGLVRIDPAGFGLMYALRYRSPHTPVAIRCDSIPLRKLFRACHAEPLLCDATPSP